MYFRKQLPGTESVESAAINAAVGLLEGGDSLPSEYYGDWTEYERALFELLARQFPRVGVDTGSRALAFRHEVVRRFEREEGEDEGSHYRFDPRN